MINKDCSFSKFSDLLGIQKVLFDSLLEDTTLQQAVENVKDVYLKKYYGENLELLKGSKADVDSFLGDVASAMYLSVVDETDGIMFDGYTEQEVHKIVTDRVSAWADPLYAVDMPSLNLETRSEDDAMEDTGTSTEVQPKAEYLGDFGGNAITEPLNFSIKTLTNLGDLKYNYYKSASLAQSKLGRDLFNDFFKAAFIDLSKPTDAYNDAPVPVRTSREIDSNVKKMKSNLFKTMFPGEELYQNGITRIDFDQKINDFENKLQSLNGGSGLFVQDLLRWTVTNDPRIVAYNAMVTLKHFDDLAVAYGKGLLSVKPNLHGNYSETYADLKYGAAKTSNMRTNWSNEELVSIVQETTPIFKTIIETTNVINADGIRTGNYLRPDQVYYAMSKLKNSINKDDMTGSIKNAIVAALEDYYSGTSALLDTGDVKALLSVYQKVYSDKPTNDYLRKNKDMRSVIDNIEALQESSLMQVYRDHFSGHLNLNLLDVVSASISKIDLMNYGEVSYDYASKEFKSVTLQNKLRDQSFNVIKALGAQSRNGSDHILNNWRNTLNVEATDDSVSFNLGNDTVIYKPLEGLFEDATGNEFDFNSIEVPTDAITLNIKDEERNDGQDYGAYRKALDIFSVIAGQPVSSLNYEIAQVLNDNLGKNHIRDLLTIAGNIIYTSHLKSTHLPNLNNMSKMDIKDSLQGVSALLGTYNFNKLWNPNGYFNIDFGDHSFQAIRNYSDVINEVHGSNIKSTTINAAGSAIPTYTLSRMINDLKGVVDLTRNASNFGTTTETPLSRNMFVTNTNNDLLKRVEVRLTLRSNDGSVIPSSKLTDVETVMYDIFSDYAEQKLHPDELQRNPKFQATNYADKSQHAAIVINGDTDMEVGDTGVIKKWRDFSTQDFKTHFFFTQKSYYDNLFNTVREDFTNLFRSGVLHPAYMRSTQVLRAAINAKMAMDENYVLEGQVSSSDLPSNFHGAKLEKEIAAYNKLESLRQFQGEAIDLSSKDINDTLAVLTDKILSESLAEADIVNVKTIMYELDPSTKTPVLNRTLLHLQKKYNSQSYAKEVERNFLEGLESIGFTLDYLNSGNFSANKLMERASKRWPMSDFKDESSGRYKLYTGQLNGEYKMNPMLQQYLWERNLVTENFQNVTVGSIVGHPHKTKAGASEETMISARTVAMFKRMVIHQATFHPYNLNLINGVGFYNKVAYIKDPSSKVFSPYGLSNEVDVTDGATFQSPLLTRLQNNSLLDQSAGVTQKSIGGSIDKRYNGAGLLKHAAHSLTNERLRNENADAKFSMMQLLKKGMSEKFNVAGTNVKVDISRDYNGNEIMLENIDTFDDVSFYNEPTGEYLSVVRIIPAPGTWKTDNEYHVIYRNLETGKMLDPQTVAINNLHDLWQALGGKNSISYNSEEHNASLNGNPNLKGYVWSDKSWDALAEYVNRVGTWSNVKEVGALVGDNIGVTAEDIIMAHNSTVINPNLATVQATKSTHSPSQKTIIQPLKHSFTGQFTFSSGQKVGVQNENDSSILNRNNETPLKRPVLVSNMHTGIQLNSDHETDDSIVTEPTQITNTLNFNGDTPEYAEAAYKAIYKYIDNSLSKILPDVNVAFISPEAKYRVYDIITNELIRSFDGKDMGNMAGSIMSKVKAEVEDYKNDLRLLAKEKPNNPEYNKALIKLGDFDENRFKTPFSDSNMYGAFSTTVANFFTKNGIRRKLPGMAAVISPYSGFFGVRTINDGKGNTKVVLEQGYNEWKKSILDRGETDALNFSAVHEESPITASNKHTVEIFDTIRDGEGKVTYLDTPEKYYAFKTSTELYTKLNTASRDLKPTLHKWTTTGVEGSMNYFDLPHSKLGFLNDKLKEEVNKLRGLSVGLKSSESGGTTLSRGFISNQGLSEFELEKDGGNTTIFSNQINKVSALIKQHNDLVKMAGMSDDYPPLVLEYTTTPLDDNADIQVDYNISSKVAFTDDQKRLLKNELSEVLNKLHRDKLVPLPITSLTTTNALKEFNIVKDQADRTITQNALESYQEYVSYNPEASIADWMRDTRPLLHVETFETVPGEILMPAVNKGRYGLSANDQVHHVNEQFFFNRINTNSLPDAAVPHDFYVKSDTGEHLYVLLQDSENHKSLSLNEKQIDTLPVQQEDGTTKVFKVDNGGNITYELGYSTLYQSNVGGKIRNYVVVNNSDDLKKLSVITKGNNSPYSDIVTNFSSGRRVADISLDYLSGKKSAKAVRQIAQYKEQLSRLDKLNPKIAASEDLKATQDSALINMFNSTWAQSQVESLNNRLADLKSKKNVDKDQVASAEYKLGKMEDYLKLASEYELAPEGDAKSDLGMNLIAISEDNKQRALMTLDNQIAKTVASLQKLGTNADSIYAAMNAYQYTEMREANERQAQQIHSSFQVQLNVTAARIPGQHMQSYMGQKIVGFVHSEENLSFVSPFHMWITGEDFDIDKVFITQYSVDDNGKLIGWGNQFNYSTPETLSKSLQLPLPDGNVRTFRSPNLDEKPALTRKQYNDINNYLVTKKGFNEYVDAIKGLGDITDVSVEPDTSVPGTDVSIPNSDKVIKHIQNYFLQDINNRYPKEATLNVLVNSINGSINDIRNVNAQYSPVDFGKAGDAAAGSAKGAAFNKISPLNPVDIAKAKNANMIGKDVIGISASAGLKVYSALSNAFVKIKKLGNEFGLKIAREVHRYTKANNGGIVISDPIPMVGIAGINYTSNVDEYMAYYSKAMQQLGVQLDPDELAKAEVNIRQRLRYREDIALDLSAILSAATDNAKELILGRINAGPESVVFYLTGLMYGYDFESLSNLMTSKEADAMLALASRNVFTGKKSSITKALSQLGKGYLNPRDHLDLDTASAIVDQLKTNKELNDKVRGKFDKNIVDAALKNPFRYIETAMSLKLLTKGINITNTTDIEGNYSTDNVLIPKRRNVEDIEQAEQMESMFDQEQNDYNEDAAQMELQEEVDRQAQDAENEYQDYPEDYDPSGESASYAPAKKTIYAETAYQRYLEANDKYVPKVSRNTIDELTKFDKMSQDVTVLSQILSINQSIKVTDYDLYKYFKGIVNYTTKNINEDPDIETRNLMPIYNYSIPLKTIEDFDTFVSDPSFRKEVIDSYAGDGLNVLGVLVESDHFFKMFELAVKTDVIKNNFSAKNKLVRSLAEKAAVMLKQEFPFNRKAYGTISDLADKIVINNFLGKAAFSFNLKAGDYTDPSTPLYADKTITLENMEGRSEFINWFESTVIPDLKAGRLRDSANEYYPESNNNVKENLFLQQLTVDVKRDSNTNQTYTFYKLPFNMTGNLTESEKVSMDNIITSFATLRNQSYGGNKVLDLLYLYNLIVNKNKSTGVSFNRLFDSVSEGFNNDSFMTQFVKFESDLDWSEIKLQDDVHYHLSDLVRGGVVNVVDALPLITENRPSPEYVAKDSWNADMGEKQRTIYVKVDDVYVPLEKPQFNDKVINIHSGDENLHDTMMNNREYVKSRRLNNFLDNIDLKQLNCK